MSREKNARAYSVTDLSTAPVELQRRGETGAFYQHIPVPLPDQLVIFILGTDKVDVGQGEEVTLTYKDESFYLGHIEGPSRSLCWEQRNAKVPEIMVSKKEKGMAKLLIEQCLSVSSKSSNDLPVLESHVVPKSEDKGEKSTAAAEKGKTGDTSERQAKSKRRSSLTKNEPTSAGPANKKQRTQKSNTRTRNAKNGNKAESSALLAEQAEHCDKENKHGNVPVKTEDSKKDVPHVPFTSLSGAHGKQKVAVCKDLTSRTSSRPSSRWGHSLCFIHKNQSVLIGGQGDKQQLSKDSVWLLDTETRKWKTAEARSEGQKPEYRMGHTATYDPMMRCIYVYGGSKHSRWFHDVHMLDVDEWKWQLVKVSGKAPTRAYHSATLYRHELWIFGGVYPRPDPQPDGCSNEIHIFSPVMQSWYSPIVNGEKPIARSGHSATLINDKLVVFGGWDAPISYNDLHILDMSVVEWTCPEVKGTPPKPRSWHASCALSGNRIMIHGGYDGNVALDDTFIFDLDNLSWTQIEVESKPMARTGHSALCMPYRHDNEEEDEVIIFGGGDNDGAYFDDLLNILVPFSPKAVV